MYKALYGKYRILYASLSIACGVIFSLFLLWFMYQLIQSGNRDLGERERIYIADFIQAKPNEQTRVKERLPKKPQISREPPSPKISTHSDLEQGDVISVSDMTMHVEVDVADGFFFGTGDGEYLPIVKVAPIYPMQASNKGIEGYCLVEYTVTTAGTVKDVKVIEEECSHRYFQKPSVKAAYKFRYKPRVIAGNAVEVKGVKNRFLYEMRDADDE